ncbi:MAG: GAF domain-containing protein [Acidobacteria bacterium]|nr:GAF domain-containing protein [Acidobacteriota bacterium]
MPVSPGHDDARVQLARMALSDRLPLVQALHEVAHLAASVLQVERVSIWRLLDGRQAIRCVLLHQPGRPDVTDGVILHEVDFPYYFQALEQRRVVAVSEAGGGQVAAEFKDSYFAPLDITAMLDAPVYEQSAVTAIVCHEHLHTPRTWTPAEAEFAAAVADTVSRLYGEEGLARAWGTLGTYRQEVEQLRQISVLGRMAAGIAHDFGNVLLVAEGNAELILSQGDAGSNVSSLARGILTATERGRHLVDALLRLGRPASSKPRVVDVASLLASSKPLLRMAAGRQANLTMEAPPGLSRVMIDPAELERALLNVVTNARDAVTQGGHVHVAAWEGPLRPGSNPSLVVIEVRDDGAGMDEATLARIFEPFFSTKDERGTGLGLANVQQTLVLAGGFVEAESTPGGGTTIRLCLPAIGGPRAIPPPSSAGVGTAEGR